MKSVGSDRVALSKKSSEDDQIQGTFIPFEESKSSVGLSTPEKKCSSEEAQELKSKSPESDPVSAEQLKSSPYASPP